MNTTDIQAVARRATNDREFKGKYVIVSTVKDGVRLYMGNGFQPDKARAFHYNYDQDKVGDQVFECALNGITLELEEAR